MTRDSTGCCSRAPLATGHAGVRQRDYTGGRTSALRRPIAHRLGLSHSTVKHHLANARSKVGAETTAQLVWILAPRLPEPEQVAQSGE